MPYNPANWLRREIHGAPVYVYPARPDWFVPNEHADRLLQDLAAGARDVHDPELRRFVTRLPDAAPDPYEGRDAALTTDHLTELWLHITNRCNLACTHCLFVSGPDSDVELPAPRVLDVARQARRLGCRVFALTGGEPFVHPEFGDVMSGLLALPGTNIAILTNGMSLRDRAGMIDAWPSDRVHLQVSIDGPRSEHDCMRGSGAFDRLASNVQWLQASGRPWTLSMCVTAGNVDRMVDAIDLAEAWGASNVHFMWCFARGRAGVHDLPTPEALFDRFVEAAERAEAIGVGLDNLDAMAGQVFSPPGTRYDGGNCGWESVALGPDGLLYPSAATVGVAALATPLNGSLEQAWRDSPVLDRVRRASVVQRPDKAGALRFITGGGDPDHSYSAGKTFVGDDPYLAFHERVALWLIARKAAEQPAEGPPRLRLKMGEVLRSCGPHGPVATVHSNCLLALAGDDSRALVGRFYTQAADARNEEIANPICYPEDLIRHIPAEHRFRGYGCGSPVVDADLQPGQTVADLGSGAGIECFIASRLVGATGRVIGVDMLDAMLARAERGAMGVRANLGYDNLTFRKGYLESLPLEETSIDVMLSNCVLNLSTDKRRLFAGILRALKPGGRLVVSDVVCEAEPSAAIRNDETLRGECIAGALAQKDLMGLLAETGFQAVRVLKRFPYRMVAGHPFFSLTFEAHRPMPVEECVRVMYPGPAAELMTASGVVLPAGVVMDLGRDEADAFGDALFQFDPESGAVLNAEMTPGCACAIPPDAEDPTTATSCCSAPAEQAPSCCSGPPAVDGDAQGASCCGAPEAKHEVDCMVCGTPLVYDTVERERACHYCGNPGATAASCEKGHFVCDACHAAGSREVIERTLLATRETDMVALFQALHNHPAVALHGPEHHAMAPGIIVAAYRNAGGEATDDDILNAIRRGAKTPGGQCGFMGVCGAAASVGIAFGVILDSNPVKAKQRQTIQQASAEALRRIAAHEAARCCQRDVWLALKTAAELSRTMLPVALKADAPLVCRQMHLNHECIGAACPLHPKRRGA